jgi:hypothetical protein
MQSPKRDACNGKTVDARGRAERHFPQDLRVCRAGGEPRKPRRYRLLVLILYLLDVDERCDTDVHVFSALGFGAVRLPFRHAPRVTSSRRKRKRCRAQRVSPKCRRSTRTTASNGGRHDDQHDADQSTPFHATPIMATPQLSFYGPPARASDEDARAQRRKSYAQGTPSTCRSGQTWVSRHTPSGATVTQRTSLAGVWSSTISMTIASALWRRSDSAARATVYPGSSSRETG